MNPLGKVFRHGGGGTTHLFSTLGITPGADWTVPAGQTIILDIDATLGCVEVDGILQTDLNPRTLTAQCIEIHDGGAIEFGTQSAPLTALTTINLTGAYIPLHGSGTDVTNDGMNRGLMVMPGGRLDLHGTPPTTLWTTLNANYTSGTAVTLAATTGWGAADVAIACTEFPNTYPSLLGDQTEQRTLIVSGTAGTLSSGLPTSRWGVLQYPIDTPVSGSGMSLTQGTFSAKKAHANVPIVLDQRARVVNLTRNIVITCPNDSDWTTKGHGVHVMWMGDGTTNLPLARLEGVQIRRGGQRGAIGRYPFHAHMLSYNEISGAFQADSASYVKKCVVWQSENRAYTVHGTCGMTWEDNIAYDIKGHAFFLEDGSERRNSIRRNSMLKVRNPYGGAAFLPLPDYLKGDPLPGSFVSMSGDGTTVTVNWNSHGMFSGQTLSVNGSSNASYNVYRTSVVVTSANQFTYLSAGTGSATGGTFYYGNDQIKLHDFASSGYWITNLDNYIEDNYASDCVSGDKNSAFIAGNGAWVSLAAQCFGHSRNVILNPNGIDTLLLKGFTCHSNYGHGLMFGGPVTDEIGTAFDPQLTKYFPASGTFLSSDHVFWKNETGAYFNNVNIPNYQRWTVADNGQTDWRGSTNPGGLSSQHLLIGNSLNNAILTLLAGTGHPTSPFTGDIYPRSAFFPYHGTVRFFDCTAVNYPYARFAYVDPHDKGSAGGVSDGAPDNYDVPGVEYFQGAYNTNLRLINSHYGEMCPPIHLDGRSVDVPGFERHYAVAPVWCDVEGKYGTAGKFMLPFSRDGSGNMTAVDDFFLSGAASPVDGPLTGTVVCKTTTTRYFGAGFADEIGIDSDTLFALGSFSSLTPFTITRQNVATGATIGTPYLKKEAFVHNSAFAGYASWAMQSGGRFQIDFTDGSTTVAPPSTYLYFQLCNANVSGDFVILGLPWANASVPRICFGNSFSLEPATTQMGHGLAPYTMNTMASAADVAANRATLVTTAAAGANDAAKLAAVVADTSGQTYFRDTTNNRVWVRYTAKPFLPFPAPFGGLGSIYDIQFVIIKV